MPAISLCMIVRNEADVLGRCLASVRAAVDEIIIVDTGSTDGTADIARSFGAHVIPFKWIDDFAAARNASFAAATCPYILWLDADDILLPADLQKLQERKEGLDKDIYYLRYDYAQDAAGKSICILYRERLVRRSPAGHWKYPIHEVYSDPQAVANEWTDIAVTHKRKDDRPDNGRNLRIFRSCMKDGPYATDARMLYYYGRELHDAGHHAKAVQAFRKFLADGTGWAEDRYNARFRTAECLLMLAKGNEKRSADYRAQAREEAVLALQQEGSRAEARFILGNIAFDTGLYGEAIFWYEQCLVPLPDTGAIVSTYYYGLGPLLQLMFCHDRLGNAARAYEYNEQVLQIRPGDGGLLNNRAYFAGRTASTRVPQKPVVDIIIPTLGNWPYLRTTLQSIEACTGIAYRIIVINSGNSPVPAGLPGKPLVLSPSTPLYFSQAINLGLQHCIADFICLLNDDVIVTRNWLQPLVDQSKATGGIVHPLSNNNTGWLHHYDLRVQGLSLNERWQLQEGTMVSSGGERLEPSMLYDAGLGRDRVFSTAWAPFFCVVFPKIMVEKIGVLDESFINGCEDVQYCQRAGTAGLATFVAEKSFVFHFGSVTLKQLQSRYPQEFQAIDQYNHQYDGARKLIAIRAGHTFHPWHPSDRLTTGLGGAETAVAVLAAALVGQGHRVLVFGYFGNREGVTDGVEYWDDSRYEDYAARYSVDIFIACRHASMLARPLSARQTYLWLHDLVAVDTSLDENDILKQYTTNLLTNIICLSPWHRDYASMAHGIDPNTIRIIGNGIDRTLFNGSYERTADRLLYTSCPSRGLSIALDIFAELRKTHPNASFDVYGSFTNWEDRSRTNEEEMKKIEALKMRLQSDAGVRFLGQVSQAQLAIACQQAGIWFYPSVVPETYCIAALEAQAGGLHCIASAAGALSTTVSEHGHVIHENPGTPAFQAAALAALSQALSNDDDSIRAAVSSWALAQTWEARAHEWSHLFTLSPALYRPVPA